MYKQYKYRKVIQPTQPVVELHWTGTTLGDHQRGTVTVKANANNNHEQCQYSYSVNTITLLILQLLLSRVIVPS
jgi:hypothetical protein